MPGMEGRNTAREALIAELLGDADELLTRMEQVKTDLPGIAESVTASLRRAGEQSKADIDAASARVGRDLEAHTNGALAEMRELATRIETVAGRLDRRERRLARVAVLCGMAGGVLVAALLGVAAAILLA